MIVAVQLVALIYGTVSLWNGRPLYYAFSENRAAGGAGYDIDAQNWLSPAGRRRHSRRIGTACRAGSGRRCRRIRTRQKIVTSAIIGGDDVISMPRYFKPWEQGLPALRTQLKKVDDVAYFSAAEKKKPQRAHAGGGVAHRSAKFDSADRTRASSARGVRPDQSEDRSDLQPQKIAILPPLHVLGFETVP